MLINHDVTPGRSLGGVVLGTNISLLLPRLHGRKLEHNNSWVVVDDGWLSISYDQEGLVDALTCNETFPGRYGNKLWAGMSVHDVLKTSRSHVASAGCVMVDGIDGIGLPLPREYDDFERITDFLPLDFVFKEMSVFKKRDG